MDLLAVCFWDEHDCELLACFGESLMSMLEVVVGCVLFAVKVPRLPSFGGLRAALILFRHSLLGDSRGTGLKVL